MEDKPLGKCEIIGLGLSLLWTLFSHIAQRDALATFGSAALRCVVDANEDCTSPKNGDLTNAIK